MEAPTPAADTEPVIRVRGLVNRFGDQVVHDGVDLDVLPGEILGVVGGSGSGKSVLMRSILGLRTPDAGQIEVLGVDARSEAPEDRLHIERNTGVLFQDGALFSSLTVGENVQVPLKEHHRDLPDSECDKRECHDVASDRPFAMLIEEAFPDRNVREACRRNPGHRKKEQPGSEDEAAVGLQSQPNCPNGSDCHAGHIEQAKFAVNVQFHVVKPKPQLNWT